MGVVSGKVDDSAEAISSRPEGVCHAHLRETLGLNGRSLLAIALIAAAAILGAFGAFVFLTERGVANEIKGFVLLLIAAVLFVGGSMLWELRAIRRLLDRKDPG